MNLQQSSCELTFPGPSAFNLGPFARSRCGGMVPFTDGLLRLLSQRFRFIRPTDTNGGLPGGSVDLPRRLRETSIVEQGNGPECTRGRYTQNQRGGCGIFGMTLNFQVRE